MGIDISELPERYQRQALQKYNAASQREVGKKALTKYHNEPTEARGILFDSKKEARRYEELIVMLHAGEIEDLRLQQDFTLQEAYTTIDGRRIRAIRYCADFAYRKTGDGERIVEDVKSRATKTKSYVIKAKMMQERFGVAIKEV